MFIIIFLYYQEKTLVSFLKDNWARKWNTKLEIHVHWTGVRWMRITYKDHVIKLLFSAFVALKGMYKI